MKPSSPRRRVLAITKLPNVLTRLVLVSSIATLGSLNLLAAVMAAPLAANIEIKNTAVGSFVDADYPDSTPPTVVESNEVTVTVSEVAGIDISTLRLPEEAPAGVPVAGTYQGNGTISSGDVVYFYYTLTNTGNDSTQFFIPGTPSIAATDGSFNSLNPIKIISYDTDGVGVNTPVAVDFTVPAAGGRTGPTTAAGTNGLLGANGMIPAGGSVTIRVPIKIVATTGNIAVRLGDTGSPTLQNQPYVSGSGDAYTIDNPINTPGDTIVLPTTSEREASLTQTLAIMTQAVISVDFGDAPDTYGTLLNSLNSNGEGGARHEISSLYLGAGVSAESNATLAGDSNDDGVIFSPDLTAPYQTIVQAGIANDIRVMAHGSGYLNAWIDYNEDGDFNDPGEQVFTNQSVNDGDNTISFTPPSTVLHGSTYARFRLSSTSVAAPSPNGLIVGGEVEDYRVDVTAPIPSSSCINTGLLNGGFETPVISGPIIPRQSYVNDTIKAYFEIDVPGWNTSSTYNAVEIWQSTALGVPAYEGLQFAELNAYDVSGLFQDIATIPGTVLRWQFAHRAREMGTGVVVDTMGLNVGAPGSSLSNQGTYSTDSTGWVLYQGTYTVPSGQYITRFQFDAISSGGGSNGAGNFLDAVKFSTSTCIPTVLPPRVDLDGNNSSNATGDDYRNRFFVGGSAVAAADSDVVITDDGANISRAAITLTTRPDTTDESLTIDATAGGTVTGVTVISYNSTTGRLLLNGVASKADYQKIIATLKYNNIKATPTNGDRIIQVKVFDSDSAMSNTAISTIIVGPVTHPNLLLVKRITTINGSQLIGSQYDLSGYINSSSNFDDDNVLNESTNPLKPDTDKWPNTSLDGTNSAFLIGGLSGGTVKPKDEIEYTIYFLSAGDADATGVKFCDLVPDNQTFVPNAYGAAANGLDRGIVLSTNSTVTPLTNLDDGDTGRYYAPADVNTPSICKKFNSSGGVIASGSAANNRGAIVVNLGTVTKPSATASPSAGHGYIRFQAKVD
jgi:uncharacterized repeat protein (TIGR01451 family)